MFRTYGELFESETTGDLVFRDWIRNILFECGRCGAAFEPARDDVEETDYVLCAWCEAWYLREEMPFPVPRW